MQNFFLGIIEITLGMTILILLMLILLKLIGGKFTAKCRYILWTLVMIRLAVPLSFGILPALIEVPVEPEPEPVQIQIPVVSYTPIPQEPAAVPQQEQLQMPTLPAETTMFTEPEPDPLTWEEISEYIPYLYLTGAAVFLLWNLLAYTIYTRRILRSAKPADTGIREIYTAVCCRKGIHHPPVLLVSAVINSPAAFGLIRRRIVLPDIEFTENALVGTLSHEVTHCRREDLWIKAVCLLARSFHWFNPLVHLAAFRCEMEMELSCDESVLAGCSEDTRAVYGEIMLDIIRRCRNNRGALTTHFNPKKNAVKLRLQNILYGSGKKRGLWLIVVCLVLCLIAGAVVACTTDVPEEENEPETTETPEEPLPEAPESGEYPSMEAYVNERMAQKNIVSYYSISKHSEFPDGGADVWTSTANVTDTKLIVFEKKGEVAGLSEQGVLECWEYRYLLKLDVPADDVMTVDGDFDGWFDMEGQHTVVALRYPDGTYTVLMDNITGDGIDFTGYRDTYEEAIYDWYVTESGLDLPLYVEDWSEQITSPTGEYLGNHPVHRFDGDGWGIYIPVSAWYRSSDAMENQWIWCSSYLTGSMLTVDEFSHTLEDEYAAAELQGYTPTDRTKRIWELDMDDIHSYYYYYENPDGDFWRVTIAWTEEAITDYPYIAIEPQVLKLMAESFVVYSDQKYAVNTITSSIYRCNDMYIHENTTIHGESTVTFPNGFGSFELYSCKVILCDDNCDPYSVVFRQFWGYAGGWPLELAAEYEVSDIWNYPTRLYLCTVPEENLENMRGTPEEIEAYGYRRAYLYLMTLTENLYAYICVKPPEDINTTPAPENEQELADILVSGAQITILTQNIPDTAPAAEPTLEQQLDELNLYREGNQYRAIQALLNHDSIAIEQAMNLPTGTGQMFTDITISSWSIERTQGEDYYNPILLSLDIPESNSSVFPNGKSQWIVDEGLDGVILIQNNQPFDSTPPPTTDAEEAVWIWLRATGQVILPLNRDLTPTEFAEFSRQTTEYACRHADGTLNSIRESVEICFGSTEYFTDTILYSNDGIYYGVGGHGAARHSYNWLGETQNADGSTSVKILFYTDAGKYIPAKTVEYTLRSVGEDLYGQTIWSFESCTVLEDHGYPPFFRWT